MNGPLLNGLVTLFLVLSVMPDRMAVGFSKATLVMEQDIPSRTCRYSRAYGLMHVRCAHLDKDKIPSNLRTEIQILDASFNRLRMLTNSSLSSYTNLVYLYLGDNFIKRIEEGTFSALRYLKVLDLTRNGCDSLPKGLFQLPYLEKLYLADNMLNDDSFKHLDVKSPLTFLQLSENKLCEIPQLGPLSTLIHLNLSNNAICTVSPEDLAPYCSLKTLDLSGNPIRFNGCECQTLNAWLKARGIHSRPVFNCTEQPDLDCSRPEFGNKTANLYDGCTNILRLQVETENARITWILIACCISGFLLCLVMGLFFVHRRNKRRATKLKEEQKLNANNANTELLNSNLNQPENT